MSSVSAASVLATYGVIYFTHPVDPEYAGSGFSWTVTHFLPAAFITSVLWIVALVFVISAWRKVAGQKVVFQLLPRLLLLPYLFFVGHLGVKLAPIFLR